MIIDLSSPCIECLQTCVIVSQAQKRSWFQCPVFLPYENLHEEPEDTGEIFTDKLFLDRQMHDPIPRDKYAR